MTTNRIKNIFYYSDIETYDPSNTVQFWVAGCQSEQDGYKVFYNIKEYYEYIVAPAPKGFRKVFVFHNVDYDLGVIQDYAIKHEGYVRNPKEKGRLKAFYNAQHTEMYNDNPKAPIIFTDSMHLMKGSLRSWGEKAGLYKGEYSYFPEKYEEPTQELLDYLKRDCEIIAYWYPKLKGEESFSEGLITISSIAQNSIKKNYKSILGQNIKTGSFRTMFSATTKDKNKTPIPKALKTHINDKIREFEQYEYDLSLIDGKSRYGLDKSVKEEYKSMLRRYWLKQYSKEYQDFSKLQRTASKHLKNGIKSEEVDKFFNLKMPKGEDVDFAKIAEKYHKAKIVNIMNKKISSSMRGGISYLNPNHANKLLKNGGSIDVNSLYPFILLEYRIPNVYKGSSKDNYINPTKYYVAEIKRLRATCKKDKHPFLKRSTRYTKDKEYKREIDWIGENVKGRFNTVLTSVDLNYMYEVYDVHEIEYGTIYYYESDDNWTKAVRNHILKWKTIKEQSTGAEREFAKMMLNTVWGRWGMYEKEVKNGGVKVDVGDKQTNLVSASFTTALARVYLNKMINIFGDDFVYSDTDSVHFLFRKFKTPKSLKKAFGDKIDPNVFGAWDLEKVWSEAKYLKSKTYAYVDKKTKKLSVTTAGTKIKIKSLNEFQRGATFPTLKHETDKETGLIKLYNSTFTL